MASNPQINVSVVIPALNEAANIERSVGSAQDAGAFEIIVADGGSEDETVSTAQKLGCQIVTSPRGRGIQQNAGAKIATGQMLLFLHADNYLAEGCIDQIKDTVHSKGAQFGCFKQRIDAKGFKFRLLEWGNAFRARRLRMIYGDQGIFIAKKLFDDVGNFAEVELMEDVLISQKLKEKRALAAFLDGPIHVSARKWLQDGVIRRTLKNWRLRRDLSRGVSLESIARKYYPVLF